MFVEVNNMSDRSTQQSLHYSVNSPTYIDERIAVYDADTDAEYYYLLKELYTVAGLADAAGEIVELYDYDSYGAVRIYQPDQTLAGKGDYDADGDVDLIDFIRFQTCFTGDGGGPPVSGCEVFDFDTDDDVDLTDLQAFWTCFAGPGARGGAMTPFAFSFSILNPYCFTGRRLDFIDTASRQLYHYRARTYDPLHARFNQRDPAGYADGMNLYEYVRSRPTVSADPDGHQSCMEFSGAWTHMEMQTTRILSKRLTTDWQADYTLDKGQELCCSELAVIQVADSAVLRSRAPDYIRPPHVDATKRPFYDHYRYASKKFWPVNRVSMSDAPGDASYFWRRTTDIDQSFETCVVCKEGKCKGTIISCFRWGHIWKKTTGESEEPVNGTSMAEEEDKKLRYEVTLWGGYDRQWGIVVIGADERAEVGPHLGPLPAFAGAKPTPRFLTLVKPYGYK